MPVERDTLYRRKRAFGISGDGDHEDALDGVENAEALFGSYAALTKDERFRFRRPRAD